MANVFYRQNKLDIAFSLYNQVRPVQSAIAFCGQIQKVLFHVAFSYNNRPILLY